MIRVAVDSQIAAFSQAGIGMFVSTLGMWLSRVDHDATYVSITPTNASSDFWMPGRWWWDQVTFPRRAGREHADVMFKPAFSVPVRSSIPTVVVLHDLAVRRFPGHVHKPSAWFYGRWLPWTLRFAARIVAVSEFTKQEAVDALGLPPERIQVVLQGAEQVSVTDTAVSNVRKRYDLPEKFILHVGTIEPRKNLAFLVRVFARFRQRYPDYQLVLVGSRSWLSGDLHEEIRRQRLERAVRIIGSIDDAELLPLYRAARVLAFPSRYEGFGRPPLEAMAAGTPVVAARTAAIPEVVGGAGLLVIGYDQAAWVEALAAAGEDPDQRRRLSSAGLERSRRFSWEQAAQAIASVLHDVARHG